MNARLFSFSCALGALLGSVPSQAQVKPAANTETLLLQEPTISAEHIVFVYAQDLWIVARDGGEARRLTSSPGVERLPSLSPDGKWVAFTGQYEGNADVYVLSTDGGMPRRLTWHPSFDGVADWHPDGKRVLFRSRRESGARYEKLFVVDVAGGTPRALPIPRAYHAEYHPSATKIAYHAGTRRVSQLEALPRRSHDSPVWIYDVQSHEVEQVPHVTATDTFPCWANGAPLLRVRSRRAHEPLPVRPRWRQCRAVDAVPPTSTCATSMGSTARWCSSRRARCTCSTPNKRRRAGCRSRCAPTAWRPLPAWKEVEGFVRSADIAPNGRRAVFEARGEIVTVPREHGDARVLSGDARCPRAQPEVVARRRANRLLERCERRVPARGARSSRPRRTALVRSRCDGRRRCGWRQFLLRTALESKWRAHSVCRQEQPCRFRHAEDGGGDRSRALAGVRSGSSAPRSLGRPTASGWAFEDRNPHTVYDRIALFELATGENDSDHRRLPARRRTRRSHATASTCSSRRRCSPGRNGSGST